MSTETIEIPHPGGVYINIGSAKFHITVKVKSLSIRCCDGGDAPNGERIFTHMPAGNEVLVGVN